MTLDLHNLNNELELFKAFVIFLLNKNLLLEDFKHYISITTCFLPDLNLVEGSHTAPSPLINSARKVCWNDSFKITFVFVYKC